MVTAARTDVGTRQRPSPSRAASHSRTQPVPGPGLSLIGTVVEVLETYASGAVGGSTQPGHDGGPVVLASLAYSEGAATQELALRVVRRWLRELPERINAVGAFGGLGGFLAGVRAGATIHPEMAALADVLVEQTRRWLPSVRWGTSLVAWHDYDLFRGPAGLVLAGATRGRRADPFVRATEHLARLCGDPGLEPLRAGTDIDPRSAFNVGRINTGMGHGVTGVASALRHAVETFEDGDKYRGPLNRACAWLVREAFLARHDFITWPPVGRDGVAPSRQADHRQAWCYGTPGVAWTLWDAGRVLGDSDLQVLGEEAMRSFCRIFDEDAYIDKHDVGEALGICHGVAGTLAVAEAFARHVGLKEAAALRDHLEAYLIARTDEIVDLARADMTVLSGAGGILSVVLTARGGPRDWLSQVALR